MKIFIHDIVSVTIDHPTRLDNGTVSNHLRIVQQELIDDKVRNVAHEITLFSDKGVEVKRV